MTDKLIKVYPGRNLPEEDDSFNAHHNSGRSIKETAVGRLKGRWRRLCKKQDIHYSFSPTLIIACVILHNIAESAGADVGLPSRSVDEARRLEAGHP